MDRILKKIYWKKENGKWDVTEIALDIFASAVVVAAVQLILFMFN